MHSRIIASKNSAFTAAIATYDQLIEKEYGQLEKSRNECETERRNSITSWESIACRAAGIAIEFSMNAT